MNNQPGTAAENQTTAQRYLRVSFARWDIDLYTQDTEQMFRQIGTDGVAVFKAQPGFTPLLVFKFKAVFSIVAPHQQPKSG